MKKLVIYTCLFGDKEEIGNPLGRLINTTTDLSISFICFTNNRKLTSPVWEFIYLDDYLSGERLSRKPKTMPHLYLQQWEYSLYIDNIVEFKRLPNSNDLKTDKPYLFKLYKHTRDYLIHEADAIVSLGYDDPEIIATQLEAYKKIYPLESITPLSTCTIMLRSHTHPQVIKFGEAWWDQFLTYSKRDQMSFDFCLKYTDTQVEYFEKTKSDNDVTYKTDNMRGRVRASFDAVKYAYIHRDEPDAVSNPQQHFLTSKKEMDIDYNKKMDMLSYLAYKTKSSLGNNHVPRRRITPIIQSVLTYKTSTPNTLYINIESNRATAFSAQDANDSSVAIHQFLFSIDKKGQSKVISINQDLLVKKLKLPNVDFVFSKYVIFNVDNKNIDDIHNALIDLEGQDFLLLLLANEPIQLEKIIELDNRLKEVYQVATKIEVNSMHHDALNDPMPNSMISFLCEKK